MHATTDFGRVWVAVALLLSGVAAEAPAGTWVEAPAGAGRGRAGPSRVRVARVRAPSHAAAPVAAFREGYNYPVSHQHFPPAPASVINHGITADISEPRLPDGYVGPSLLVASPPPPPPPPPPPQPQLPLAAGPAYNNYANYQENEIQRHVYVHVAPDETPAVQEPLVVNIPKPKKQVKIVFIKAPTVAPPPPAYVNVPQPDPEKTVIYVLSKKAELKPSVVLSTPAPTLPAKPEVFFLRYKTNEVHGQPQIVYAGGQGVKPLADSYGLPLSAPLDGLRYAGNAAHATAATPVANYYNTL